MSAVPARNVIGIDAGRESDGPAVGGAPSVARRKLLVLYDEMPVGINTVRDYLDSFRLHSRHDVYYAPAVRDADCHAPLECFDAVLVHYSVRLSLKNHLSEETARALAEYDGPKILFIQDEYDTTNTACDWIERLGIDVVFTCVPDEYRQHVYPAERFPNVEFVQTLTGFVPPWAEREEYAPRPMAERETLIGYRGRPLAYWYGDLGREKLTIGIRMREFCEARGLPCDIEWSEEKRIYGPAWDEFLAGCRATLATESGSNVFDFDGEIRKAVLNELLRRPAATYEELHERFVAPHEGLVRMNQISPRVFESIAHGTALVMFEGTYSGVVRPDEHYIPLKKDYSNVDDVLDRLQDVEGLEAMAARAHADVIASGQWGYASFIERVDEAVDRHAGPVRNWEPRTVVVGFRRGDEQRDFHVSNGLPSPDVLGEEDVWPEEIGIDLWKLVDPRMWRDAVVHTAQALGTLLAALWLTITIMPWLGHPTTREMWRTRLGEYWLSLPRGIRWLLKVLLLPFRSLLVSQEALKQQAKAKRRQKQSTAVGPSARNEG